MNKPETPALADNAPLVSMLQEFISAPERRFAYHEYDRGAEARRFGYRPFASSDRKAFIVTADEAAIELGSPRHQSLTSVILRPSSSSKPPISSALPKECSESCAPL